VRNHIVIVSEESVYAHHYKCGIGEVVDTLASALRQYYDVTVITPGKGKFGSVKGLLQLGVYGAAFRSAAAAKINDIQPQLVHNFADPDLIDYLDVDCLKILSFDRWEDDVADHLDSVSKYDHVVTLSGAYAQELLAEHPEAAQWPLKGIINGIDARLYKPGGFFHAHRTKEELRKKVYETLGREDIGKPLIVSTGRLAEIKGSDDLISAIPAIADMGVDLIVAGTGDDKYETQLRKLHDAGKVIYLSRLGAYCETCVALSAADFYLTPSRHEVCGLQPMKAARMGSIPIVRPVGGMGENFDSTTAVLVTDTIEEAVQRALALTEVEYTAIREKAMAADWTWETRVLPWVELYGLETAPAETYCLRTNSGSTRGVTASEVVATAPVRCPFAYKEDANE